MLKKFLVKIILFILENSFILFKWLIASNFKFSYKLNILFFISELITF